MDGLTGANSWKRKPLGPVKLTLLVAAAAAILLVAVPVLGLMIWTQTRSPEEKAVIERLGADAPAIESAKLQVTVSLRDPSSAIFSNVVAAHSPRFKGSTVICGHVAARNGFGGMNAPKGFISIPGAGVTMEPELSAPGVTHGPGGDFDRFSRDWSDNCINSDGGILP